MPEGNAIQGHCLCGAVRVTAVLPHRHVEACHCTRCRRWSGGPLLAVQTEAEPRFEGEGITVYDSSDWAERGFCRTCGSHLFYRLKAGGLTMIPVGLFGDDELWALNQQVFIDEKPAFYAFANETETLTGSEVFALFGAPSE